MDLQECHASASTDMRSYAKMDLGRDLNSHPRLIENI